MFVESEIIEDTCKCLDQDMFFDLQWGSVE